MNRQEKTHRLARSRTAIIDDACAGRPMRLSIAGRNLKTRPGQCWVTTVFKHADRATFESKAGPLLDKVARPMDGHGFHIDNQTEAPVAIAGFPVVPPRSSVSVGLKDGKWEANP
jgi:hypothetical protein